MMEHILDNWHWIAIGFFFGVLLGFTLGIAIIVGYLQNQEREKHLEELNQHFDKIK